MQPRPERPADAAAIRALIGEAFRDLARSDGSEPAIVDRLREAGALTLSLVIEAPAGLAAHIAFSPVAIPAARGWFGLGPLATRLAYRRQGFAACLVTTGLAMLRARGAAGCVVLGNPAYYTRFGFAPDPALTLPGVPASHFMTLAFGTDRPSGVVSYHPAFG